jgi:hypothetical protein
LTICVAANTTTVNVIKEQFSQDQIKSFNLSDGENIGQPFFDHKCNTFASGLGELLLVEDKLEEMGRNPSDFANTSYFNDVIEPLALVTRQDDRVWSDFVALVLTAIFYAEENGISSHNASAMPEVHLFGPQFTYMLRDSIMAVGSYKDIYQRYVESRYARSGLNLLYNENSYTPLLYVPQDLKLEKDD